MSDKVYRLITDRIINLIESGHFDWKKTWDMKLFPRSYVRDKPYRGINFFMLLDGAGRGYRSPYWLTFKDCQRLGGTVKKGEHGMPVVFWKPIYGEKTREDPVTGEKKRVTAVVKTILRYYTVFNWEQTENIPEKTLPEGVATIQSAEEFMAALPEQPKIQHGKPAYWPLFDYITMPDRCEFTESKEYYATLFHETIHWTGAKKRLDRGFGAHFGTEPYAKEELVAELGAAFLCSLTGIDQTVDENHAAYIQSWVKVLRDDPKMIVSAAAKACAAADWCRGIKKEEFVYSEPAVSEATMEVPA